MIVVALGLSDFCLCCQDEVHIKNIANGIKDKSETSVEMDGAA